MQVDIIDDPYSFARLRDNWNEVYDADPAAQLFLSWDWLSGWMPQLQGPRLVLAVREDNSPGRRYCAFLPLRIETRIGQAGVFVNDLKMAGNHAADYTGVVCAPRAEGRAIAAIARQLKKMHWARIHLDNFRATPARLKLLLAHFPQAGFTTTEVDRISKVDGIDNNICPYADLPDSWDDYLATLSANTRQKIRRVLRLTASGETGLRVTHATPETVERDIDMLLRYWAIKWRPRKGDLTDGLVESNRRMLSRAFRDGLLFLPVLWQGERPLAALATLVDTRKKSFLFYMTGRDEAFDGASSGLILHAHSIRHAIANGFRRYDFLRGNERYKYSFGVQQTRIVYVTITTRDGRNIGNRIDPRTVSDVLSEATSLHQAGKLAEAERGYQQILTVVPRHPDTLHRLGQLFASRGQHADAVRTFKSLTRVKPEAAKAWLCLAQACEQFGRWADAADAYRELIARAPNVPDIPDKLAKALARLARAGEPEAGGFAEIALRSDQHVPAQKAAAGLS